jgi:hypothetical protein
MLSTLRSSPATEDGPALKSGTATHRPSRTVVTRCPEKSSLVANRLFRRAGRGRAEAALWRAAKAESPAPRQAGCLTLSSKDCVQMRRTSWCGINLAKDFNFAYKVPVL